MSFERIMTLAKKTEVPTSKIYGLRVYRRMFAYITPFFNKPDNRIYTIYAQTYKDDDIDVKELVRIMEHPNCNVRRLDIVIPKDITLKTLDTLLYSLVLYPTRFFRCTLSLDIPRCEIIERVAAAIPRSPTLWKVTAFHCDHLNLEPLHSLVRVAHHLNVLLIYSGLDVLCKDYFELVNGTREGNRLTSLYGVTPSTPHAELDVLFNTPLRNIPSHLRSGNLVANMWRFRNTEFHLIDCEQVEKMFAMWAQGRLYVNGVINNPQYRMLEYHEFFLPSKYETLLSCTQLERWGRHRPLRTSGFYLASGDLSCDFNRCFVEQDENEY